jgi:Flp pilus assembly protein TadD
MNPSLKTASINAATESAIAKAEASGNAQEALAILANVHQKNPEDAIVATRYGRALREDDQINASIRTLAPFTKGENANLEATTEMAMAQIAVGDFKAAEDFASRSIEMNDKNARGYLALGTAQDALGRHQDAEIAFRQGLKNWKGDPTPILNNLALNLASQGHLEESLSLLEKALSISPNRMDLERNRRIIATLVETSGPRAPAPSAKPAEDQQSAVAPVEFPEGMTPAKKPENKVAEKVEAEKEISAEELNASVKPAANAEVKLQEQESNSKEEVTVENNKAVNMQSQKLTVKNLRTKSGAKLNE